MWCSIQILIWVFWLIDLGCGHQGICIFKTLLVIQLITYKRIKTTYINMYCESVCSDVLSVVVYGRCSIYLCWMFIVDWIEFRDGHNYGYLEKFVEDARFKLSFFKGCVGFRWASQVVWRVRNLPAVWEIHVQFLGQEGPLEKGLATHSSILAWRIPWAGKPDRLQSMGLQRIGPNWALNT